MTEPQSEEELAGVYEAWMNDPEAVAELETDLAAEESANPALAEQGRRVEEAARRWLEGGADR